LFWAFFHSGFRLMGNFSLQKGPCNFLKLRISPWGNPFLLLLSLFFFYLAFSFIHWRHLPLVPVLIPSPPLSPPPAQAGSDGLGRIQAGGPELQPGGAAAAWAQARGRAVVARSCGLAARGAAAARAQARAQACARAGRASAGRARAGTRRLQQAAGVGTSSAGGAAGDWRRGRLGT
jgi:hypothetical protein